MIDPVVRPARPEDGDELALLEAEARAALVGARGGERWLAEHPALAPAWSDVPAGRTVLVAVLDAPGLTTAVPVGYLVLDVAGEVALIVQVYVTAGARELGFGDALLAAALEASRDAGATLLEGHALPGDRDTKNLYERAGITARLLTVSIRLR